MATKAKSKPWEKSPRRKKAKIKLTEESKAFAKEEAKKAGRPYPNLVDNMRAARRQSLGKKGKA